jgi:hypothetical protein
MADVTRSARDRSTVRDLLARGLSDREVSVISGVPPATVGRWRRSWPAREIRWRRAHEQSYAYLLGLYLGDGCVQVSKHGQVLLRICLDAGYPAVIDDAWPAMQLSLLTQVRTFIVAAAYRRSTSKGRTSCGYGPFLSTGPAESMSARCA